MEQLTNSTEPQLKAALGWLIFVAIVALFFDLAMLLQRFINIAIINSAITIFIIVVSMEERSGLYPNQELRGWEL